MCWRLTLFQLKKINFFLSWMFNNLWRRILFNNVPYFSPVLCYMEERFLPIFISSCFMWTCYGIKRFIYLWNWQHNNRDDLTVKPNFLWHDKRPMIFSSSLSSNLWALSPLITPQTLDSGVRDGELVAGNIVLLSLIQNAFFSSNFAPVRKGSLGWWPSWKNICILPIFWYRPISRLKLFTNNVGNYRGAIFLMSIISICFPVRDEWRQDVRYAINMSNVCQWWWKNSESYYEKTKRRRKIDRVK